MERCQLTGDVLERELGVVLEGSIICRRYLAAGGLFWGGRVCCAG